MLHVYFGNDTVTVRQKAYDLIAEKTADGIIAERIDSESYAPGVLADVAGSSSLFGTNSLYVVDTPSLQKDFYEDVLDHLPLLAESSHIFVVIEEGLVD